MPLGVSNKYRLYQVLRFILLYVFLLVVNPIISAFFFVIPIWEFDVLYYTEIFF